MSRSCCCGEQPRNNFNYDNGKLDEYSKTTDNISDGVPVCVESLTFELYGKIDEFKNYFEKYPFTHYELLEGEVLDKNKLNPESVNPTSKI